MAIEYRIQEWDGKFTIQCKTTTIKRKLWRKEEVVEWVRANDWGFAMCYSPFLPSMPPCKAFDTIEAARRQIERWRKGCTYYDESGSEIKT